MRDQAVSVPGLERPVTADEYGRRYGLAGFVVIKRIRQGELKGVRSGRVWYVEDTPPPQASTPQLTEEVPPEPDDRTPGPYRLSRLLTLVVCVPAAIMLGVMVLVPGEVSVKEIVQSREVRSFERKGVRGQAYLLHTNQGEVETSAELFKRAREGDTLLIQKGLITHGVRDVDQRVALVRDGQIVQTERPSDVFHALMALFVLIPVLSFRPYRTWRDDISMKAAFVAIPFVALFVLLSAVLGG